MSGLYLSTFVFDEMFAEVLAADEAEQRAIEAGRAAAVEKADALLDSVIPTEIADNCIREHVETRWAASQGENATVLKGHMYRMRPAAWDTAVGWNEDDCWLHLWVEQQVTTAADDGNGFFAFLGSNKPNSLSRGRVLLYTQDIWQTSNVAEIVAGVYKNYLARKANYDERAFALHRRQIADWRRVFVKRIDAGSDLSKFRASAQTALAELEAIDPDNAAVYRDEYNDFLLWLDVAEAEYQAYHQAAEERAVIWAQMVSDYNRHLEDVQKRFDAEYKTWELEYALVADDDDGELYVETERVTVMENGALAAETEWRVAERGTIIEGRRFAHPVSITGPVVCRVSEGKHPTENVSPGWGWGVYALPIDVESARAAIAERPRPYENDLPPVSPPSTAD